VQALPHGFWRGARLAILIHRLARRDLRTQNRPLVVRKPGEVVDSVTMCVRGITDRRLVFRDFKDSCAAQG